MRSDTHAWERPEDERLLEIAAHPLWRLMRAAARLRDEGHGATVSYSRKVFIPLTQLCRDVCHYCTFAKAPRQVSRPFLTPDEVLALARAGSAQQCKEALFTLGDKPESRYRVARATLESMGYASTVDYVAAVAERVLSETGLLPHVNSGVLGLDDYRALRRVAPSMGLMLESSADRLAERGGPHFGSPDKRPAARLESIADAGRAGVPLTTGLLVGIGETRVERIDSLLHIRRLHETYGHVQEIIIQGFAPKPRTRMSAMPAAPLEELVWTIAMARIAFGPQMSIQTPPNLQPDRLRALLAAGIDDWGGVSPVSADHVNPEAPWPALASLADQTAAAGKVLTERLTVHPRYVRDASRWIDDGLRARVLSMSDGGGFARDDHWSPGAAMAPPARQYAVRVGRRGRIQRGMQFVLSAAAAGSTLSHTAVVSLLEARGAVLDDVVTAANHLRREVCGQRVSYVVTRNINYTNICVKRCGFCAFAKGRRHDDLRGPAYLLDFDEIGRRAQEAWQRGATEVCLQGGIHPSFDGTTYLNIVRTVRRAAPGIHVHAFSPLEVVHGARSLGVPVREYLLRLKDEGLSSLPGTSAEVLDDRVRVLICADKLTTDEWIDVVEQAHGVGLRTTSTLMFGHVDDYASWATHLLALRALQQRTGGLTEFVPLPFVPMEAPMFRRGAARRGPTFRESMLVHAVARLVLHPWITNIQASWPKLGREGARRALEAGANDFGGTLMNESISRAAGAAHGQELPPAEMEALIVAAGRIPMQRTTFYAQASAERRETSLRAGPLQPLNQTRSSGCITAMRPPESEKTRSLTC